MFNKNDSHTSHTVISTRGNNSSRDPQQQGLEEEFLATKITSCPSTQLNKRFLKTQECTLRSKFHATTEHTTKEITRTHERMCSDEPRRRSRAPLRGPENFSGPFHREVKLPLHPCMYSLTHSTYVPGDTIILHPFAGARASGGSGRFHGNQPQLGFISRAIFSARRISPFPDSFKLYIRSVKCGGMYVHNLISYGGDEMK